LSMSQAARHRSTRPFSRADIMTSDTLKCELSELRPTAVDFTVVFSGKRNKRINGYYRPATREIIIHNRNFSDDNNLIFTTLHEYAHHIMATEKGAKGPRCHTNEFWSTFHDLLGLAEVKDLYKNPAKKKEFSEATKNLQNLITDSGRIMIEIGKALREAYAICESHGARFEDYVMRTLKQSMTWAKACMAAAGMDLPAELGAENLKSLTAIKDDDKRTAETEALTGDKSPQQVKAARVGDMGHEDPTIRLEKELARITRTIERLTCRKSEIENTLKRDEA
jgi:hypothetical protein